jgi:transcriptional regulator with XRE-family HTH domain
MQEDDYFNKPKFLSRLGAHISKVRRAKGYSQDRLCLEAGFARGTLSRIEAGLVDPKASTLFRIAGVLDIHPRKILELGR